MRSAVDEGPIVDSAGQLWCQGLPFVGERPLEPEEAQALRRRVRRVGWELLAGLLVLALCLVATALMAVAIEDRLDKQGASGILTVGALALLGIGLPVAVMLWLRGRISRFRQLRRDSEGGRVLIFAAAEEPTFAKPDLGPRYLEVLAASQLLLCRDGQPVAAAETAEIYEAASPPEAAPRFAVPRAWRAELGADLSVERRRLSPAELGELAAHIARLKRPSATLLVLAGLLGVALVAALWTRGDWSDISAREMIPGVLWALGLVLNGWLYWRDFRLARRLELDRGNEWVVIFEEEIEGTLATVEVLPASAALWTESGHPSRWRQQEKRRERERAKAPPR